MRARMPTSLTIASFMAVAGIGDALLFRAAVDASIARMSGRRKPETYTIATLTQRPQSLALPAALHGSNASRRRSARHGPVASLPTGNTASPPLGRDIPTPRHPIPASKQHGHRKRFDGIRGPEFQMQKYGEKVDILLPYAEHRQGNPGGFHREIQPVSQLPY